MSKNVKVDFMNNTILVTKTFLKRAETPFSEEFKELVALKRELPTYKLAIQKGHPQSKQFRPTYSQMVDYITFQSRSEELMEEFHRVQVFGRTKGNAYMEVLQWFNSRFPEFQGECRKDYEIMAA